MEMHDDSHLSDHELLLAIDGELSRGRARRVQQHLARCGTCRARQQEIDQASADFARLHRRGLDPQLPQAGETRASLRAELAQAAALPPKGWTQGLALSAAACVLAMLAIFVLGYRRPYSRVVSIPNPALTPGLAMPVSREQICRVETAKNRLVPVSLRRRVFEEYGIPNAEPPAYEVDYLITPALGGADDIRNLWPQSYSSTVWNAQVKDTLEDRLRDMVCEGKLDLATAQRDIANDWIAAYKKYFQADAPSSAQW